MHPIAWSPWGLGEKGRSRSVGINDVLRERIGWAVLGWIQLVPFWVDTKRNPADDPSQSMPLRAPGPVPTWAVPLLRPQTPWRFSDVSSEEAASPVTSHSKHTTHLPSLVDHSEDPAVVSDAPMHVPLVDSLQGRSSLPVSIGATAVIRPARPSTVSSLGTSPLESHLSTCAPPKIRKRDSFYAHRGGSSIPFPLPPSREFRDEEDRITRCFPG